MMFHFNLHHITLILNGYLSTSCSPLPFGLLSSQVSGNGITFSHVQLPTYLFSNPWWVICFFFGKMALILINVFKWVWYSIKYLTTNSNMSFNRCNHTHWQSLFPDKDQFTINVITFLDVSPNMIKIYAINKYLTKISIIWNPACIH